MKGEVQMSDTIIHRLRSLPLQDRRLVIILAATALVALLIGLAGGGLTALVRGGVPAALPPSGYRSPPGRPLCLHPAGHGPRGGAHRPRGGGADGPGPGRVPAGPARIRLPLPYGARGQCILLLALLRPGGPAPRLCRRRTRQRRGQGGPGPTLAFRSRSHRHGAGLRSWALRFRDRISTPL